MLRDWSPNQHVCCSHTFAPKCTLVGKKKKKKSPIYLKLLLTDTLPCRSDGPDVVARRPVELHSTVGSQDVSQKQLSVAVTTKSLCHRSVKDLTPALRKPPDVHISLFEGFWMN